MKGMKMNEEEKKIVEPEVDLAAEIVKAQELAQAAQAEMEAERLKRKQAEAQLVNLRPAPQPEKLEHPREYAKVLVAAEDMTNKEFWETSLKYRQSNLDRYGRDIWSDTGKPTDDTKEVARVIDRLLKESTSDAEFRMKLNLTLEDDKKIAMILAKRERERDKASR